MPATIFRSESHALLTSAAVRNDVERTVTAYRRAVRALASMILTHWPELRHAKSKCGAVESLFHATAKRPFVKYPVVDRMMGKMPSYLRRAAIEAAWGAVSSYLSNLDHWIDDSERKAGSRPPKLGISNVFPSLYGGNMILIAKDWKQVQIKLLTSTGEWAFSPQLKVRGRMKRPGLGKTLCSSLIIRGAKVMLSCPAQVLRPAYQKNTDVGRVCSVDVGINTAATAAVVDSTGTVIARKFITCGRHNDQRDNLAVQVANKQGKSHGGSDKRLGKGFCKTLYRRIAGLSLDAARTIAGEVTAFAKQFGAQVLVIENLKGWRPKGPMKAMRQRFHRFQHRMLVKCLSGKAEEMGMRIVEVYPRGTSRWAFDGSGKVSRDKTNAQLATFANKKRYNADLNAAYNIAARCLALLLKIAVPGLAGNGKSAETGKSTGSASRMPIVLADIWAFHAQKLAVAR